MPAVDCKKLSVACHEHAGASSGGESKRKSTIDRE